MLFRSPTEDMDIIDSNKNTNRSPSKLPSWVLPAVGVGLLAATLSNPVISTLALAALPLFVSTNPLSNQNTNGISARPLFTQEYINSKEYLDSAFHMENLLPPGFINSKTIVRGMTLRTYKDLKGVFDGLSGSKTDPAEGKGLVHFTSEIETAIDHSIHYEHGHLPVLVKINKDEDFRVWNNVFTFDYVDGDDILSVLVAEVVF